MKHIRIVALSLVAALGVTVLPGVSQASAAPATGTVVIQSQVGGGQVADIKGGSTASKAVAQTHTADGTLAQSFRFGTCDKSGRCEIRNVKSNKCLDVKGGKKAKGTRVQQYTCNGTKAQKWLPVASGAKLYRLQSAVAANRWLDVKGGKAKNGTPLQIWTSNGTKAQKFAFVDAPNWGLKYTQVSGATQVNVRFAGLDSIEGHWATKVAITATMTYKSTKTRTVSVTKTLASVKDDAFTWDLKDYGKWSLTAVFYNGSKKVQTEKAVTVGITAGAYIVAPLTGTMPVTMLTTSLWGADSIRGTGNKIPVIAQLARADQWNWNALPAGVHALPYLTKAQYTKSISGTSLVKNISSFQTYIKDLYALNKKSVFHLYVNDYHVALVQSLLYADKIPQANYTITLLSDGTFSYTQFAQAYEKTPDATNATYLKKWQELKDYAYKNGKVSSALTQTVAQDCIYAAVQKEPKAQWWLTRPALLTSPADNDAFAAKAIANPKVVALGINNNLNAIKAAGSQSLKEFKALFRFNDAYFAKSVESGKQVMMFLGTRLDLEQDFTDYAQFTMKYYGGGYDYYYKGHPASPTDTSPAKVAQLKTLGITDVDSSVPAELILFFNPDIYMSGYPSSTYMSVSDPDMAKGLFGLTKQDALASTSPDYSIMAWFMAPKSSYSGAIKALPGDFIMEFSDKVAKQKGYVLATWTSKSKAIVYYKLSGGSYVPVS